MEYEQFEQTVGSRRTYFVDHIDLAGNDLHVVSKPTWTVAQYNVDGSPSAGIAAVETSPDCQTCRISAERLGRVELTVSAVASSTAVVSTTFVVTVKPHHFAGGSLRVTQHRNGSIHH
jgi:hypothetical protein